MTKIPENHSFPMNYQWMERLSDDLKRTIISALQHSLDEKKEDKEPEKKPSDFAGIWEGDETAEELIAMIRSARYRDPNRIIENL